GEAGGLEPQPRREQAVARRRRSATLDAAEHGHARLEAGALLDLAADRLADAPLREELVAELVDLALVLGAVDLAALADDDDREVLPARVPLLDLAADLLHVDGALGGRDHVGAPGDPAHDGDPPRVAPHHLDDHDAVVRLGGRVQAVDRLRADPDGRLE